MQKNESLDLPRFYSDFNIFCTYQPNIFPGLIYRPTSLPRVLLLFFIVPLQIVPQCFRRSTLAPVALMAHLAHMNPVRLDVWLDVACVYKTRSEAQKACKLGKVSVNGQLAKAHRDVKAGDQLIIQRPMGRKQLLTILGVADRSVSRAEARLIYDDTSPMPTP